MRVLLALFIAALAAGCGMRIEQATDPNTFSMAPDQLGKVRRPQGIALKNGYPGPTKVEMKWSSGNTLVFDNEALTNTAIVMFTRAMEKNDLTADPQAEKRITLRVNVLGVGLNGLVIRAKVALNADFGDGTSTYIEADNGAPSNIQRVVDGAVLFTLNQLAADPKFINYVNR